MLYNNKIAKFATIVSVIPVVTTIALVVSLLGTSYAQTVVPPRATIKPRQQIITPAPRRLPTPAPRPIPAPVPRHIPKFDPIVLLPSNSFVKLNLRHQKQEHMLCYPTSASMLLSTAGWNYPPRQIKLATMGYVWHGPNTPFSYWTPMNTTSLLNGLRFLGVNNWRPQYYRLGDFQLGLEEIKDSLRKGYPVIILVNYGQRIGHAMVISGYDDRNQRLIMNDPAMNVPGIAYYTYNSLRDKYWKNSVDRRGVVFMNPKTTVASSSIMFNTASTSDDLSMDIEY
jgi:hypothetical protein